MPNEVLARVVDCIADTTRYPKELLTPDADLESDLGIDSVKRVEITVALGEEFRLDLLDEERDSSVRTIGDVAAWVSRLAQSTPHETSASQYTAEAQQKPQLPEYPSPSAPYRPDAPAPSIGKLWGTPKTRRVERSLDGEYRRFDDREPATTNATPTTPIRKPHISMPRQPSSPPQLDASQQPHIESSTAKPLDGRVAFISGSGRSVGRTIARFLASRGAAVVVNSFHSRDAGEQTAQEIVDDGGRAIHIWGSVANPDHVRGMFAQIEEQIGYLDILVCNASDGRIGSFSDLKPDDWDRAFRTNVSGHYQCAMEAKRLMQPRGGGSIVTMSAVGAHGYVDGLGSQGVVKAAVETLTKYLAAELAPYGIRANCVSGGPVYGELISKFPEAQAAQQQWESLTPGGSLTSPLDLARTIAYLVSDEAAGVNGAVWQVDQGFSAVADRRATQSAMSTDPRAGYVQPSHETPRTQSART